MRNRIASGRLSHAAAVAILALTGFARPASAQDAVPNAASAAEIRKWYLADLDTVHAKLIALAEAIPAEKYTWRPAPGVRSIGEAFMHAASEFYTFAPAAYGAPRSPVIARKREAFEAFEAKGTKDEVLKHLKEGFAYTQQSVGGMDASALTGTRKLYGSDHTIVETSFAMTDDLHEHLGQLIAYARMNGVTPPWSK